MRSEIWEKIIAMDIERREIQNRIAARAAIHHGRNEFQNTDGDIQPITGTFENELQMSSVYQDAMQYIEIQDLQWSLMGIRDTGAHEQPPF